MRCVSTRSNSGRVRKSDFFFNLTNVSARSAGTQIGEIKKKIRLKKDFFLISLRRVTAQGRLAFKSASRAYRPYLYCSIEAAGGKLGAVVVP